MKKILGVLFLILLSALLCAQVAKVKFIDGTTGFAMGPKLTFNRVGDTITFESADQLLWQITTNTNPSLTFKKGIIQKIASANQDIYARITYVDSTSSDILEDYTVGMFAIGDTIKVIKKFTSEGDQINKIYFGQLPGNTTKQEKYDLAVIKKFYK